LVTRRVLPRRATPAPVRRQGGAVEQVRQLGPACVDAPRRGRACHPRTVGARLPTARWT